MPYVDAAARERLEALAASAKVAGELNYRVTLCVIDYVLQNGLNYQTINDVGGALNNADKEFYRRIAVPYEDIKIELNGDVYGPVLDLMPADPRDSGSAEADQQRRLRLGTP